MNTIGHYVCDGITFTSKINACIYANKTNKTLEWVFNNDVYSTYPWSIEPEESLDALYDRRAKELREQYDYLILFYSGGSDSHNIVESFMRQGLYIDEIVTNHISKLTRPYNVIDKHATGSSNLNAEFDLQAIPRLKELKTKLPNTIFSVMDISDRILTSVRGKKDESWVLSRGDHLALGHTFRTDYLYFDETRKRLDKGKKVAIITGLDKPRTTIIYNSFLVYFNDTTANLLPVDAHDPFYTNVTIEYFYWSKSAVSIVCKQAHIIKKFVKANPTLVPIWEQQTHAVQRRICDSITKNLIYSTTWNKEWFQADKCKYWWNSEFDHWFHNNPDLKKEQEVWQRGIEFATNEAGKFIVYNDQGKPDNLQTFNQFYTVGKML